MGDAFQSKLARLRREGQKLRKAAGHAVPSVPPASPVSPALPVPPALHGPPIPPSQAVPRSPDRPPGLNVPERPKPDAAPSDKRGGLPVWARKRLGKRAAGAGAGAISPAKPSAESALSPSLEALAAAWPKTTGDPSELVEVTGALGTFAARETRIARHGTLHGCMALSEIESASPEAIARLAKDPALLGLDLERAVYLDTETSGLSGGAGVYVYMVGLGWLEGDEYVSWQGFLRHPGEERALLSAVADRIAAASGMVSFFGKSFDRHRLEDKMRIAGVTPPFDGLPHLDLYHPFRRLTHGAFANGKLQTMERELLQFHRERDLPGALAPAAWFDYLAGRPHLLEGVFQHNHEDVLSLVALAAYLGRCEEEVRMCGAALTGPAARRAHALADTAATPAEALHWASLALERDAAGDDRRRMQLLQATLLRRGGQAGAAVAAYRAALEECADDPFAIDLYVGASMAYERGVKDAEAARWMAQCALEVGVLHGKTDRQLEALRTRVTRLSS